MQKIEKSYRGLSMLMDLNWDLALFISTLTFALFAACYLATLLS